MRVSGLVLGKAHKVTEGSAVGAWQLCAAHAALLQLRSMFCLRMMFFLCIVLGALILQGGPSH